MRIKLLATNEQSDYPEYGCIEISATDKSDAFQLGQIANQLNINKNEYVHNGSFPKEDKICIRIPLMEEINYGENKRI